MNDHGSGFTTNQMRTATQGAYYVIPHQAGLSYFVQLRHFLRRDDLKIIKPTSIYTLRGAHITGLVIDHAVRLNTAEAGQAQLVESYCAMKRGTRS